MLLIRAAALGLLLAPVTAHGQSSRPPQASDASYIEVLTQELLDSYGNAVKWHSAYLDQQDKLAEAQKRVTELEAKLKACPTPR